MQGCSAAQVNLLRELPSSAHCKPQCYISLPMNTVTYEQHESHTWQFACLEYYIYRYILVTMRVSSVVVPTKCRKCLGHLSTRIPRNPPKVVHLQVLPKTSNLMTLHLSSIKSVTLCNFPDSFPLQSGLVKFWSGPLLNDHSERWSI